MIRRSTSDETLSTLVTNHTVSSLASRNPSYHNADDLESLSSADTLAIGTSLVFCNQLQSYRRTRNFPLTTGLLRNELLIYSSIDALKNGDGPILCFQSSRFHFLKKNTPIHLVSRYENGQKIEFCKVYYKILETNLTCYVMMFADGTNTVIYNNGIKLHSDTIYKKTKLRLHGASGVTSTFGSNSIRIYALNDKSPTLVDFVTEEDFEGDCLKKLKLHPEPGACKLYDTIKHQQRSEVLRLIGEEMTLVNAPIASFVDCGGTKMDGVKIEGSIHLFESATQDEESITRDSLTLATMVAVFVEQEIQKMRGNLK
ncbi:hypothetical protein PUMCH_004992 [Australozyma saopauloensis]|uniref:Uncharacterized protein n=1 Tax=Australozyma saopauloensis TaxID=291208 RepID=A0AAX4HGG9_9ASCO|nr:hypothetical protein PUMCH_004992 [[Candida] saopauloensis]